MEIKKRKKLGNKKGQSVMGINGKAGKGGGGWNKKKTSRSLDPSSEIHLSEKLIELHFSINLLIRVFAGKILVN